jgi:hypothetical protein
MTTLDLKTCVFNCETLREQLRCRHWATAERAALEANQRIAVSELWKARAELLADGFSRELVNMMQDQFISEYMNGVEPQ